MRMAEGGPVRRPRNYAEGGSVTREDFPLARALFEVDDVAATPMQAPKRANIGWDTRLASGMANMGAYDPGNVWEGQTGPEPLITRQTQLQPVYSAEGGPQRARGPLPSKQARDLIPAYLAENEYVIPADVHRAKGTEFFDKLVAKYHRENA